MLKTTEITKEKTGDLPRIIAFIYTEITNYIFTVTLWVEGLVLPVNFSNLSVMMMYDLRNLRDKILQKFEAETMAALLAP